INGHEKIFGIVQVVAGLKNTGDSEFFRENHLSQRVDCFFLFFALGGLQFFNAVEHLTKITRRIDGYLVAYACLEFSGELNTEMTRINTVTPSITPSTEISVMIERNVRFGFKYRSARKRLNGRFNSLLAWRQNRRDSNVRASYFSACALNSSSVTNSSADACVASRSTGAARL